MKNVRAKKHLGQHFLNDEGIAKKIADSLSNYKTNVLEVGPGMGVLTKYLLDKEDIKLKVVEIDDESVSYLRKHYPQLSDDIIADNFLEMDLNKISGEQFSIIGNFPYNISSQIFFKVLDFKDKVPEVVGMLQKEVAERLAAPPGTRAQGILTIFLQAYYDVEYLFTVSPDVFTPPPKVQSGVIRVTRNNIQKLDCDEKLFKRIVKTGFNQRRKTLSNSLKSIPFNRDKVPDMEVFSKRPEQLGVNDFVALTQFIQANMLP